MWKKVKITAPYCTYISSCSSTPNSSPSSKLPSTDPAPTSSSLAKQDDDQGQCSSPWPLWTIPSPQLKSCHAKEGRGWGTLSLSWGGAGWLLGSDYRMCVCKNPLPSFLHSQHFCKAVHSLINLKLPDISVAKYLSVLEHRYGQCFGSRFRMDP